MAGPAGKYSLKNLTGKGVVGPGEIEIDIVGDNISTHYNEKLIKDLTWDAATLNGGLCTMPDVIKAGKKKN